MASDKKRRKQAKLKSPRPKPAVHPDGDRRHRGLGQAAKQAVADKRARQQFWGVPVPEDVPPPPRPSRRTGKPERQPFWDAPGDVPPEREKE
jgi:hypothetical protein